MRSTLAHSFKVLHCGYSFLFVLGFNLSETETELELIINFSFVIFELVLLTPNFVMAPFVSMMHCGLMN